jgi:tRNA splicing endonuclease
MMATPTVEELEAELAESERQTRAQIDRVMKRDARIAELEEMVTVAKQYINLDRAMRIYRTEQALGGRDDTG